MTRSDHTRFKFPSQVQVPLPTGAAAAAAAIQVSWSAADSRALEGSPAGGRARGWGGSHNELEGRFPGDRADRPQSQDERDACFGIDLKPSNPSFEWGTPRLFFRGT